MSKKFAHKNLLSIQKHSISKKKVEEIFKAVKIKSS